MYYLRLSNKRLILIFMVFNTVSENIPTNKYRKNASNEKYLKKYVSGQKTQAVR